MYPIFLGVAVTVTTAITRAFTDEEFEGDDFPASFRERFIEEHVQKRGCECPGHNRDAHRVPRDSFVVDHIIPRARGGRTSRHNAQVLCQSCNTTKGANWGISEAFRGRHSWF